MPLKRFLESIDIVITTTVLVGLTLVTLPTADACDREQRSPNESQLISRGTTAKECGEDAKPVASKYRSVEVSIVARKLCDKQEVSRWPKPTGFMAAKEFDAWWIKTGWGEKQKPQVDFSKHVLVVKMHHAGDPNFRTWGAYIDREGDLSVQCTYYTKMGVQPSDKNLLLFMTVPREAVKTIDLWLAKLKNSKAANFQQEDKP